MATEIKTELDAFHEFVGGILKSGRRDFTPEDCVEVWRSIQENMDESLAAIRAGLEDMEAGRGKPADEAFAEIRERIRSRGQK